MILFGNINKGLADYRNTADAVLLDVREEDEFLAGHIPGAVNQPLSAIDRITLPKEKALFVYCLRGTRSKRAAAILKKMGYQAKSIGGIMDYAGPVEK